MDDDRIARIFRNEYGRAVSVLYRGRGGPAGAAGPGPAAGGGGAPPGWPPAGGSRAARPPPLKFRRPETWS